MARITEKQIEQHLRRTGASSIGDTERLGGIDTCNTAERRVLWEKFKHLRDLRLPGESTDPRCAAVMRECRKRAARMVSAGEMSLFNPHRNKEQPCRP